MILGRKNMEQKNIQPNVAGQLNKKEVQPNKSERLFRPVDWFTAIVTTILVFLGYFYTLAPDLTLEDCGELAVGSFYAGVPHPPGYPLWTIYSWLFTVLLPVSNIAFRVAVSSAVAGAISCGLLALIVSRGSSMILESISELSVIPRNKENWICAVAGFVSGILLGYNGFMWSQAIIVEVYTLSVLTLMIMLCFFLRWLYKPSQLRYLYLAFFMFGVCFTNHQTLIVAAMGIEVLVAAVNRKLGRDLFFANSIIYTLGLIARLTGNLSTFNDNNPLFFIFNIIGIGSFYGWLYLSLKDEKYEIWYEKLIPVGSHLIGNVLIYILWVLGSKTGWMTDQKITTLLLLYNFLGVSVLYIVLGLNGKAELICTKFKHVIILGFLWIAGISFYLYMPIASMTNPPMNWGYPRTKEGFIHAFTRGQYDRTKPTNNIKSFLNQTQMYFEEATKEFNGVFLVISFLPFLFYKRMQQRERAWLVGTASIFVCLAFLLLVLLNPGTDKQSRDLTKVFFAASHVLLAMWCGYGLTLISGFIAVKYEETRVILLVGAAVAVAFAIFDTTYTLSEILNPLTRRIAIFGLLITVFALGVMLMKRKGSPLVAILALIVISPAYNIASHWSDNEQRGHLFGFWYGHDMFTPPFTDETGKPIYPEMTRNAILFGGTDPGRFCPTYMIFCESFIPPSKKRDPNFDRRDVYIITQNALADSTYLCYIRAHYNRSTQIDPPFFQEIVGKKLAKFVAPLDRFFTNLGAKVEARRRAEGVYPPKEIYCPTPEDSQTCFNEYIEDVQRRAAAGLLKPGEDFRVIDGKVQVSGQVSVMQINGLLAKIIFDKNPDHEFFVEESFPIDWMFPYLTPYGIIMKINRHPVPEFTEEMIKKDHLFWTKYSERLIGNWITYDTSIEDICKFAVRVYKHRDYTGFIGDKKFIRDDDAQKAFSKLRSAIAGVYTWRINQSRSVEEQHRLIKEADFAFRQAYAFCPYSPEALFRYSNLLVSLGRIKDALLLANTSYEIDPENKNIEELIKNLDQMMAAQQRADQLQVQIAQLESQLKTNPDNVEVALNLADIYNKLQLTNRASSILASVSVPLEQLFKSKTSNIKTALGLALLYNYRNDIAKLGPVLDAISVNPEADPNTLLFCAQNFLRSGQIPKVEMVLRRVVELVPNSAEAWFDLAAFQAYQNKSTEALSNLARAIEINRLQRTQDPNLRNLAELAKTDPRFSAIADLPLFKQITSGK